MHSTRVTIETARAEIESTPRPALCLKYGWPADYNPGHETLINAVWLEQWQERWQAEQAELAKQLELFA